MNHKIRHQILPPNTKKCSNENLKNILILLASESFNYEWNLEYFKNHTIIFTAIIKINQVEMKPLLFEK
jgi:hypothetical protein